MELLFHELGINGYILLAQVVNFLILLFVLKKFVYGPMINFLDKRKDLIQGGLEKAEKADLELTKIHKIKEEKIIEAEREADIIIERSKKSAIEKGNIILKEATSKSENVLSEAKKMAEEERSEALLRLKKEIGEMAISAAARVLKNKITDKEDEEIVENYLNSLNSSAVN